MVNNYPLYNSKILREFSSVHPYNFKITISMEPQRELAAHWQHIGTDFRYIFKCTLVKLWEGWGSYLPFYLHSTSHFYSWQALNTSWLFLTCPNWRLWKSSSSRYRMHELSYLKILDKKINVNLNARINYPAHSDSVSIFELVMGWGRMSKNNMRCA